MISDVSIAVADAAEAPAFVHLRGLTRENAVSEARLASVGITASTWAESIRSGELLGVAAKRHGALVGYCFGNTLTGEVVVLALLPAVEGQGLGRELLARVVEALRELGHRRLFLGCAADPTVRSHGFYRALGWRPTGAIDAYGDEILELLLGPLGPEARDAYDETRS
jgi:GNAT superfamily N-acetyltransferase